MYGAAMQTIENTGSDADFATLYSLVTKIDEQLTTKTILDSSSAVEPLRSNEVLPFLPGSAFLAEQETELIQQFEFTVDPSKYPEPYKNYNIYDLFLSLVYKIFQPIFQCSFITNSDDILGASNVAAIHGSKCLNASDYIGAAPPPCSYSDHSESYTVAASGRTWAANMVHVTANKLKREAYYVDEWKNYDVNVNPLPEKDQCNTYFIASESPCNGDCVISRLCDWTKTGVAYSVYSVEDSSTEEASIGGSLGSVNPALLRPSIYSIESENIEKIAETPVCGIEAIYPRYVETYSADLTSLHINDVVNIYKPYILNDCCVEFDPSKVNDSNFSEVYGAPYEANAATYSWMAISMCDYTHMNDTDPKDIKVAIRLNKFKTQVNIDGETITKYIGIPTALRIRLKGVYRPAIRKVWYDAIFHTLRHCMGYAPYNVYSSAEPYALGNTWDTTIHTYIQDCANYGAMAYAAPAFHSDSAYIANYKTTNWLDIWFEQYLIGRKGYICNNGSATSDSYEIPGGLCAPKSADAVQLDNVSRKTCQYGYTKGKLHLPWHGGCENTFCENSYEDPNNPNAGGEENSFLAAHGNTFNILYDLYDTIEQHKISEQELCDSVRVIDMGFDVESFAYSESTNEASFSVTDLLEIYKTQFGYSSYIDFDNSQHFLFLQNMFYSTIQNHYPLLNPGVYIEGPTCYDPKCYEYEYADIYLYSAATLVNELVVNADIVGGADYSVMLKYSTEDHTHYITTNPEKYVWLDSEVKYNKPVSSIQIFNSSCYSQSPNDPSQVIIDSSIKSETDLNAYSITIRPSSVVEDLTKWVPTNYHIYAGIPVLSKQNAIRLTLTGCENLLAPAWEIGMLAKKELETLDASTASTIFTKIDWVWLTNNGTKTVQTTAELPQEYYSLLVDPSLRTTDSLQLNVLKPRSYGEFKCVTAPYTPANTGEKWYPLYHSEGGKAELRATLLKNGNTSTPVSKDFTRDDLTYSIDVTDNSNASDRQFYGLIALDLIIYPYGDPATGDAALASFGADALASTRSTVMNWEVDYEQAEGEDRVDQGNIIFKAYSADAASTGCKTIFDSVMEYSRIITINVSKP